ncbi:MAG: DUF4168 domain-containing protein [Microcystaceae cyanobacterium]
MLKLTLKSTLKFTALSSCLLISLFSFPQVANSQANQLGAPSPSQVAASQDIKPLELQQFVQVLKRWQGLDMEAQKRIVEGIKAENFTPQRFMEINEVKSKSAGGSTSLSADDLDKYQKIMTRIQDIEKLIQEKRKQAVASQGLSIERFNQIGYAAEQNPEMKQKVQQMLGGNAQKNPTTQARPKQ